MRRAFIVCFTVMIVSFSPALSRASGCMDIGGDILGARTPGISTSVFHSAASGAGSASFHVRETLKYFGTRMDMPSYSLPDRSMEYSSAGSSASWSGKKTAVAIISSAILPGLGELYLYTHSGDKATLARVPVFFALDGYLWYGYYHNHSKGKDFKQDYMDYADAHWSLDRFLTKHPCCAGYGGCGSWQWFNQHCQGEFNYFYYTPREIDTEEYYENIGKYNAFVYGWDDWNNQSNYWTPHREHYWSLREESDKYLNRGSQYLMTLLVNRVVSMLDTGWIAYRMSKGEDPEKGWSLRFKSYDEAPSLIISRRF